MSTYSILQYSKLKQLASAATEDDQCDSPSMKDASDHRASESYIKRFSHSAQSWEVVSLHLVAKHEYTVLLDGKMEHTCELYREYRFPYVVQERTEKE